jgi:hypothetical protein
VKCHTEKHTKLNASSVGLNVNTVSSWFTLEFTNVKTLCCGNNNLSGMPECRTRVWVPMWGGLEYLHHSPESCKRRGKKNPLPRGITGPPCSWRIKIWGPGPSNWGSLKRDSKIWSWVMWDLNPRVTALAIVQVNYRPILLSERVFNIRKTHNCQIEKKNLIISFRWETDTKTRWMTDRRSELNFNFKNQEVEF